MLQMGPIRIVQIGINHDVNDMPTASSSRSPILLCMDGANHDRLYMVVTEEWIDHEGSDWLYHDGEDGIDHDG